MAPLGYYDTEIDLSGILERLLRIEIVWRVVAAKSVLPSQEMSVSLDHETSSTPDFNRDSSFDRISSWARRGQIARIRLRSHLSRVERPRPRLASALTLTQAVLHGFH